MIYLINIKYEKQIIYFPEQANLRTKKVTKKEDKNQKEVRKCEQNKKETRK